MTKRRRRIRRCRYMKTQNVIVENNIRSFFVFALLTFPLKMCIIVVENLLEGTADVFEKKSRRISEGMES